MLSADEMSGVCQWAFDYPRSRLYTYLFVSSFCMATTFRQPTLTVAKQRRVYKHTVAERG